MDCGSSVFAGKLTSAKQMLQHLQGKNGDRFARRLFEDDATWNAVSKGIVSGNGDWLQVARLLMPMADGAGAEQLSTDLALALPKAPRNVLRLISSPGTPKAYRTPNICSAPIPTPGKSWLIAYIARSTRAVQGIHEPGLLKHREACLKALRNVDLSGPSESYE
jgi:hypothetical protein